MFNKILIANRGEIAVRIIRACKTLGIKTVAVYSQVDENSLHTVLADEKVCIGPGNSRESYLDMTKIISAALISGAEAIHPGFGFLSERSDFVDLCKENNIKFIGPDSKIIDSMGNKSKARNTMIEAGVPVVPGSKEPVFESEDGKKIADEIGYPVIVKASSGGGGKGMRIVDEDSDFEKLFNLAQIESVNAFNDNTMYVEKYIKNPKHIEVQILGDSHGNVVHLGERDCSIQRNHQKMIEESPSVAISSEIRQKLGEIAVRAAKAVNYENAGTIEFLMDKDFNFYFIEMNTRIQVEHPVTEMVTGIDLIKEQIKVAAGNTLTFSQEDVELKGHSIECRINDENPMKNFMPCPGEITRLHIPGGNGIRLDSAVYQNYVIPHSYDSMVGKLIVHAKTRVEAINKMKSALSEFIIEGVETNIDLQLEILSNKKFVSGDFDTSFLASELGY